MSNRAELYCLDFPNRKRYLGVSRVGSKQRYLGHEKAALRGSHLPVHRAWRKYGDPKLTILAVLEKEMLAETEKRAIVVYGTVVPNGYNIMSGGEGALLRSAVLSPEELLRRSQSMLGDANPVNKPGVRESIARSLMGRAMDEETKSKISSALSGKKQTPEHAAAKAASKVANKAMSGKKYPQMGRDTRGERNSFFGKTHSAEFAKELSLRSLGNSYAVGERTDEQKARMRDAHLGKPLSEFHRIHLMVSIATAWAMKANRQLSLLGTS